MCLLAGAKFCHNNKQIKAQSHKRDEQCMYSVQFELSAVFFSIAGTIYIVDCDKLQETIARKKRPRELMIWQL